MAKLNKGAIQNWIPVIIGVVIVLLIGGGIWVASQYIKARSIKPLPVSIEGIQQRLFLAIYQPQLEESIKVIFYNPKEKKDILIQKIKLDYPLFSPSQTSVWGSNNAVQYFERTGEIFYFTNAMDYYHGECTVKPLITPEGETFCGEYLYKANLSTGTSTILTTIHPSKHWVLNDYDGFIYLSQQDVKQSGDQVIQKINTTNGAISTLVTFQHGENIALGRLMISEDGKYIYQASEEFFNGEKDNILRINKINAQDGKLEVIEVYRGSFIEWDTNLSFDGKRVAFYAEPETKLFVFDLLEKKLSLICESKVRSFSLLWSGNHSKILYHPEEGESFVYYNFDENSVSHATGREGRYPFLWAPSQNCIVSFYDNKGIEIFDEVAAWQTTILPSKSLEIKNISEIVGFEWF